MLNLSPHETFWVIIIGLAIAGGTIASVFRSIFHQHKCEHEEKDK